MHSSSISKTIIESGIGSRGMLARDETESIRRYLLSSIADVEERRVQGDTPGSLLMCGANQGPISQ